MEEQMSEPVVIEFSKKEIKLFEMIECEIKFDDNYFHHRSEVRPDNYHNAYDADEDFTLFRADAVFLHDGTDYIVPVFATKDRSGDWKWLVRFRPHFLGNWIFRVRVISWHPSAAATGEPSDAKRPRPTGGVFYEHTFGYKEDGSSSERDYSKHPNAEKRFSVIGANLPGPLQMPGEKDNRNYFYRWSYDGRSYQRRPFFLLGCARPWVGKILRGVGMNTLTEIPNYSSQCALPVVMS